MNRQVAANIRLKYFNLRCWMKHIQLVKNTALAIAQRFPLYMTIKTVVCVCVCVCDGAVLWQTGNRRAHVFSSTVNTLRVADRQSRQSSRVAVESFLPSSQ